MTGRHPNVSGAMCKEMSAVISEGASQFLGVPDALEACTASGVYCR